MRLVIAALLAVMPGYGVIVDRVAVAVGARVITQSEIEQRIRLTAFQNGEAPDFSLASRRQTAARLIDQRLVEHEMEVGRYPRLDSAKAQTLLHNYEEAHYGGDHAALPAALAKVQLTESELQNDLARQADLLTFLAVRFRSSARPGTQQTAGSTDDDLEAWLKEQRTRTRIDYAEKDLYP